MIKIAPQPTGEGGVDVQLQNHRVDWPTFFRVTQFVFLGMLMWQHAFFHTFAYKCDMLCGQLANYLWFLQSFEYLFAITSPWHSGMQLMEEMMDEIEQKKNVEYRKQFVT